ncbi:hypothetical protein D6825_00535, partial [Candidatus Woesearchaeota archaeon]
MKKIAVLLLVALLVACTSQAPKAADSSSELTDKAGEMVETKDVAQEQADGIAQKEPESAVQKEEDSSLGRSPPPARPLGQSEQKEVSSSKEDVESSPQETSVQSSELSPKIRDLVKRKDEKLKSLQYLYGGTDTGNLFLDTYFIKGDRMKIKKFSEDYYVLEGYYDNIYVHSAIACCEELSRCKSHNVDNTGKPFDVDVSQLSIPKTPLEWMDEIRSNAKVIGPQTVDSRSVTYIVYTDDQGREVHMWLDDTYGVPHKVEIKKGEELLSRHKFNDMKFNTLKDSDFIPP